VAWASLNENEQFVKSRKNKHPVLVLKTEKCRQAGRALLLITFLINWIFHAIY